MTGDPERLDAPNQQVVRPDASGPADEGSGAGKAPKRAAGGKPGPKGKDAPSDADAGEKGA